MGDDGTPRRVLKLIRGDTAEDEKATVATPRLPPLKAEFGRDGKPRIFGGNAPRPRTDDEFYCKYEGCPFKTDNKSTIENHEYRHKPVAPMPGMYRITPSVGGLDSWTCNGSHVLVLRWNHRPAAVAFAPNSEKTGTISRPWRFWTFEHRGNLVVMGYQCFESKEEAEQAQAIATANFQPLEVEMTVDDFLRCTEYVRESAVMFQPSGPVHFAAPSTTLEMHLEHSLGDVISPELLTDTAWVLGAYLASGVGDEIAVPSGERAAPFKERFRRWRDSTRMPYTGDDTRTPGVYQKNWFARCWRDRQPVEEEEKSPQGAASSAGSTPTSSCRSSVSSAPSSASSRQSSLSFGGDEPLSDDDDVMMTGSPPGSIAATPYDDDVGMDTPTSVSASLVEQNWCDARVPYATFAAMVAGRSSAELCRIDLTHIGVDPSSKSDCAVVYYWCVEVVDYNAYCAWISSCIENEDDRTTERGFRRCVKLASFSQENGGRFCYYFGESTTVSTRYLTFGHHSDTVAHVLHARHAATEKSFRFHFRVLAAQDNVSNARHNKRASLRMAGEVGAIVNITEESLGTHVLNAVPLGRRYSCGVSDEVLEAGELLSLLVEHLELDNEDAAIPRALLAESLPVRQALAAGILDARGHISVANQYIRLRHSSEVHLQTVCHLLRGIGCDVGSIQQASDVGYTMRVNLGAHLSALPTCLPGRRIPLPRANALKPYAAFCFGFKVNKVAHAPYYGLELDGNRRCLLDDFTVTHNSKQ
jgi:hypothetical protein